MKKAKKASTGSKISSGLSEAGPRFAVAIMAAGRGTRLKSQLPKVLHEVGGKPLLAHAIAAATRVVPARDVYAIVGHEAARYGARTDGRERGAGRLRPRHRSVGRCSANHAGDHRPAAQFSPGRAGR